MALARSSLLAPPSYRALNAAGEVNAERKLITPREVMQLVFLPWFALRPEHINNDPHWRFNDYLYSHQSLCIRTLVPNVG